MHHAGRAARAAAGGGAGAAELAPVNAAHNVAIQLVLDAGLPFLLAIVAALAMIVRCVVGANAHRRMRIDDAGIVLAVLVLLIAAMVDIALDVAAMALLFWTLLGLLWGAALTRREAERGPRAS